MRDWCSRVERSCILMSVLAEIPNFREIRRIRFTSIHSSLMHSRARFIDLRRDVTLFWGHRICVCTRLQWRTRDETPIMKRNARESWQNLRYVRTRDNYSACKFLLRILSKITRHAKRMNENEILSSFIHGNNAILRNSYWQRIFRDLW